MPGSIPINAVSVVYCTLPQAIQLTLHLRDALALVEIRILDHWWSGLKAWSHWPNGAICDSKTGINTINTEGHPLEVALCHLEHVTIDQIGVCNMSIIASWGLQTPVQPRFGARAIVDRGSVSLLWGRSGLYGEADEQWLTEIDRVLPQFIDQLSELFQRGELLTDQDRLVKLELADWICLANPRASYGYLYLDVYRKEV